MVFNIDSKYRTCPPMQRAYSRSWLHWWPLAKQRPGQLCFHSPHMKNMFAAKLIGISQTVVQCWASFCYVKAHFCMCFQTQTTPQSLLFYFLRTDILKLLAVVRRWITSHGLLCKIDSNSLFCSRSLHRIDFRNVSKSKFMLISFREWIKVKI